MPVSNLGRILDWLGAWQPYPLAMLLYVDVRHMRSINRLATLGEGDEVIRQVLHVMQEWAGDGGLAERVWSNEFVAAKVVDHGQTAVEEAARLRDRLAGIRYASMLGDNHIAVSMGLVAVQPGLRWDNQIANAAEACETAKQRGLNQIVTFNPHCGTNTATLINASHVLNFRHLMGAGRLLLDPQPIMDIRGTRPRLAKAEFLLRMDQDGRHVPLPSGTIETLEHFGLSSELDTFSAETVIGWIADHPEALARLDGVTLNLSAQSLVDGRFMNRLYHEVRGLHLPPGKLGFEITETAAIEHLELAADIIKDFRAIGCPFSLDDFGSGLCSFGYLHSLAVDTVKIDGRFIRDIAHNPVSQEIVRAIHQVARATGKRTIAEFVDEPRKLAMLQCLGIDYAQGWLFYPALPTERLLALLEEEETSLTGG